MKDNSLKNIIIFAIILLSFTGLYIVFDKLTKDDSNEDGEFLKNYEVNEYIPTYVSDEDMARMYLNDFVYIMHFDIEHSYMLLDDEYKLKKFGSIDAYKAYIYSLTHSSYKMDRYYVKDEKGYKIFGVYDTNGNVFIFKTKGVMQYSVYLDDYTVEI